MKRKVLSILMATIIASIAFTGCGGGDTNSSTTSETTDQTAEATDEGTSTEGGTTDSEGSILSEAGKDASMIDFSDAPELAYKGEITVMHYSTSEESAGNGGSDGFRTILDFWNKAYPDIEIVQSVLANDDYKTQVAVLAGANDLPDVFLTQGMNTKTWAEQDIIMDMTQIIADSPYADMYNNDMFYPFTYQDKIYGLPALTAGTCTVIVYDQLKWTEAGFGTFPETWEGIKTADAYFDGQGIDTIAFGNGSKWQANSCFVSTLGDRFTGPDWFYSLIEKTGASFKDQSFVDALTYTQELFQSGIFNVDFNSITNEDAREYYIAGDAAAVIGGNWDVSYIQSALEGTELLNTTKFAVLPQPENATASTNTQNIGLGYAMSINTKLESDPDKLAAATNLIYEITGEKYANFVGSNYALSGLTQVEDVDLSAFDQYTQDFYNYSYLDTDSAEIYDSYLSGAVWDVFNSDLQSMLNGDITPEEVASNAQIAYESSY